MDALFSKYICLPLCQPTWFLFNACLHKCHCTWQPRAHYSTTVNPLSNSLSLNNLPDINQDALQILASSNTEPDLFQHFMTDNKCLQIIQKFQQHIAIDNWVYYVYAMYGQKCFPSQLSSVPINNVCLELLHNKHILSHLWPILYNFCLYKCAFLSVYEMKNTDVLDNLNIYHTCFLFLSHDEQPSNSITNFYYYT